MRHPFGLMFLIFTERVRVTAVTSAGTGRRRAGTEVFAWPMMLARHAQMGCSVPGIGEQVKRSFRDAISRDPGQ